MKTDPDITVTVNFHREGVYALSALASLGDLVKVARTAGLAVETQAILDRPDELTRHIVELRGRWIDRVEEVSFGDLGLSRNAGARNAHGRYLSFLDGDDLWGEQWLRAAFESAVTLDAPRNAIWHPEVLYVFTDMEYDRTQEEPTLFHSLLRSSDTSAFDPLSLVFVNLWSANAFATREIYLRFPYDAVDFARGIGIEDWSWNLNTIAAGVPHHVVPGAVHLVRKKASGSVDQRNTTDQLLPSMPSSCVWSANWLHENSKRP